MLQPEITSTTEAIHHGRWIQLEPVPRYDGSWECPYTISEIGPTQSSGVKRKTPSVFSTREEAEAAASDEAQAEIDSRGPLS